MQDGAASRLAPLLVRILLGSPDAAGSELPIRVRAWDGSVIGPAGAPAFVIRHRRALRRLLWKPGEIGLVRAYISGDLDIEGDVFAALGAVQRVMRIGDQPIRLSSDDKREIVRAAVMLGAVGPEPKPPAEEFPVGRRGHSAEGPLAVDPAFFERMLGPAMAGGCALWDDAVDLDQAQALAHEAIAARLGLAPGARLLDLSRGWGAFSLYAAAEHGARVVTLARSERQAEHLRERVSQAGLTGRVDIRVGDHHAVGNGQYDAIVGLGGTEQADLLATGEIAPRLYELLAPAGRLLVQQMVRRPGPHPVRRTFTTSYMFPENAELRPLGEIVTALEEAGLEIRGISALREHHARTLRAWAANLQRHWAECGVLATPGRARVWLLYLAASALACESGRIGVHEVYAIRRDREGRAGETLVEDRAVYSR
ncbi:class I SAM-dependent methyltransferase [Actinomadura sp. HBU206391]|uniref:class I SAM-dependent methyltransferase n=1 Tax=Actinomadura sp. HBU206391 TaxID=2731692 RepID=UPI001650792C|nr:class I SAM-dependent methyltransferase [Actinomadura sp. HBU206391]MBC6461113.1 class I SAM-dependent methyltransferase [Actinomadura sp. HBU206391]